ncbi:unnamed protein product [Citrullus colocynthis]|uniref:Uncharacterized protein n=1 Tax=Citrullus colocynthis TaxID=252529 RepID=A0ABP0XYN5_9ROSI
MATEQNQNHTISVAALFSNRHASLRARVLLVVHFLPLSIPPPPPHIFHRPPPPPPPILPPLQPIHPHPHFLPLARIFTVFSNPRHSLHHALPHPRIRLPILGRCRPLGHLLPVRTKMPSCRAFLQLTLPFRDVVISCFERRVQWRIVRMGFIRSRQIPETDNPVSFSTKFEGQLKQDFFHLSLFLWFLSHLLGGEFFESCSWKNGCFYASAI